MKRTVLVLMLCISLLFTSCGKPAKNDIVEIPKPEEDKIFVVWISCYELQPLFSQGDEQKFKVKVDEIFEKCLSNGINTVFLQVRPFCDALYPSGNFPWSQYALDKKGNPPEYDPLEIFVNTAHENNIALHAWINPYRISYKPEFTPDDRFSDTSVSCDEGVYLQPANIESQKIVLDGVREILENYNVDGIHIDDYFYPVKDKGFDSAEYKTYRNNGGKMSLSDWRRSNVNSLVSAMYTLVHSFGEDKIFSISPAADITKNKFSYYADIALWCERGGYADWIIPQIYFGFEHEKKPFEKVKKEWEKLAEGSHIRLICGLAAYKINQPDSAAGSGKNEWIDNPDVIKRQIECVSADSVWSGYSLFSYSYLT
ncbi:MAG: family 10 glycosylhydrolase [Clostridia bacterium]|nr:family 10 glycosylhydrolase [Clostridia bacterium]